MEFVNQFLIVENFLRKELLKLAIKISPNDKEYLLRSNVDSTNSMMECLFVTEKYIKTKIIPYNYTVILSRQFTKSKFYLNNKNRINKFVEYLQNANIKINSNSENFIPNSYKRYFTGKTEDEKRVVNDVLNDFYGIRHAYLKNRKVDELLFYVISQDKAYLINTGTHKDIFTPENLEIILNEFPQLEHELKFGCLKGIQPGIQSSPIEIEEAWRKGINIGFIVNDKIYIGHPMTFSKFNSDLISIIQNNIYQIEQGIQTLAKKLVNKELNLENEKIRVLNHKTRVSMRIGEIWIKNSSNTFEWRIFVTYLTKIYALNEIIKINHT